MKKINIFINLLLYIKFIRLCKKCNQAIKIKFMGTIKLGLQEDFKEEEEGKEMLLESWRIDCL